MSLAEQYLLDLIAPPIGAVTWWVLSRGWAGAVQGAAVSDKTRKRQKYEFFVLLCLFYLLMFGATTYLNFIK